MQRYGLEEDYVLILLYSPTFRFTTIEDMEDRSEEGCANSTHQAAGVDGNGDLLAVCF
jgi:hypothetical protein